MMYRLLLFVLALVFAAGSAPSLAETGNADEVYARMQKVNANLNSYTASLHVDTAMHSFPFISPTLDGTAYFKRPDKSAVVFDTVPALASQFKKIYPQDEPPSEWPQMYEVTPVSDDGTVSTFRLVRKKNGRIDHVDVKADDKTATVTSRTYFYKDGGSISWQQSYDVIDGNYVVKSQTGKIDIPHYNADVTSTYHNYKLNVAVPDKVFEP
jgi:outer membrane lipoprotein-sorting protein